MIELNYCGHITFPNLKSSAKHNFYNFRPTNTNTIKPSIQRNPEEDKDQRQHQDTYSKNPIYTYSCM